MQSYLKVFCLVFVCSPRCHLLATLPLNLSEYSFQYRRSHWIPIKYNLLFIRKNSVRLQSSMSAVSSSRKFPKIASCLCNTLSWKYDLPESVACFQNLSKMRLTGIPAVQKLELVIISQLRQIKSSIASVTMVCYGIISFCRNQKL